jgi:endonuclease/exonuclease/phosphatase family metal-dependent hydrolase
MKRKYFVLTLLAVISFTTPGHAEPLTVVNLNTWGVPFAVWDTWRYSAAMNAIEEISPDVVVLEEVFTGKGSRGFESEMYPYEAKGPHKITKLLNSGIKILSKYPIEREEKFTYNNCLKDDCLSGKGALLVVIDLPSGKKLNVVGTHLNARGDDSVRISQLDQLTSFIAENKEPGAETLLSSDFNFNPTSPAYAYYLKNMKMHDVWDTLHPGDPGITYNSHENFYAYEYCTRTNFPLNDERIDYMWTEEASKILPKLSKIIFNQAPLYSDHYGLYSEFEILD